MREVDYTDERGRRFRVRLPDDVPDTEAEMGVPVGPPDVVDALELPEPFATRLHNQLHRRGLWTKTHIRKQPGALMGALQAALKVDAQLLMQAYLDLERAAASDNGRGS